MLIYDLYKDFEWNSDLYDSGKNRYNFKLTI